MSSYNLTHNLTNCNFNTENISLIIDPNQGCTRPDQSEIQITNGSIVSYNKDLGLLVLKSTEYTSVTIPCIDPTPPPPPTGYTIRIADNATIDLSNWNTGVDLYINEDLENSINLNGYSQGDTVATNVTSFRISMWDWDPHTCNVSYTMGGQLHLLYVDNYDVENCELVTLTGDVELTNISGEAW